jgi:hypothetical protein
MATTQGVLAALRQGGHTVGKLNGFRVARSGAVVRQRGSLVRVYYLAVVRSSTSKIEAYEHTLAEAGFQVERVGSYLNVTREG